MGNSGGNLERLLGPDPQVSYLPGRFRLGLRRPGIAPQYREAYEHPALQDEQWRSFAR